MTFAAATATELLIERVEHAGAEWDGFVRAQPGSTFCHLGGWQRVLEGSLGARAYYLAARDAEGTLSGVLPLARVRSVLGDCLVSVPFLNYGGALGAEDARSALVGAAADMGSRLRVKTIELRSRAREASSFRATDRKITVELALPSSEEELWNGLRSKVRSQIRRPMKEGMEYREGVDQLDAFYDVFAVNMRDLGTPVLPRAFFRHVARELSQEVVFSAVYCGDSAVAAGCGFLHGDEYEITWASSLRSHNHLSPNMLLYWETMRAALRRGARRFNFGRCTPGAGTHRFKQQWGGIDVPLGWSTWPPGDGASLPSTDNPMLKLASDVWKHMPLWGANRLGPVLSRWLP